jgi:hypothetical protein
MIEHNFPTTVKVLDDSDFGIARPGQDSTRSKGGTKWTRNWSEFARRSLNLNFSRRKTAAEVDAFEAFLIRVANAGAKFRVALPVSTVLDQLVCRPLADGTVTSFALPVTGSVTDLAVFAAGVFVDPSDYTVHDAANLVSDALATASDAALFSATNATVALLEPHYAVPGGCIKVTPSSASVQVDVVPVSGQRVSASPGDELTAHVAVDGAEAAKAGVQFYNSGGTVISTSVAATATAGTPGTWLCSTVTATAPALTASAAPIARIASTAGTDPVFFDAFGLAPGDYETWHLPSVSPVLVVFGTAPGATLDVKAITAAGTGLPLFRCVMDSNSPQRRRSPGKALPISVTLMEDWD